jgi:hypothetical protein
MKTPSSVFSHVGVIGFIEILYTVHETTSNTGLSLLYTVYSSPLHTHQGSQSSLVVSWQRICKSHYNFKTHMKSSLHSLIPFLPLFCICQLRWLCSIQFLCFQALVPAGCRLETRLESTRLPSILLLPSLKLFFITTFNGPHRKHRLFLENNVYKSTA